MLRWRGYNLRTEIEKLHRKYALNDKHFELCYTHCQIVEEIALWCAEQTDQKVDVEALSAAALLHDIGSYPLMDEYGIINRKYYQLHALLGSKILSEEGVDDKICKLIETHITMAVSKEEIVKSGKKMPEKDYSPVGPEAKILRYADRYHSKVPQFNSYDFFIGELEAKLPRQVSIVESYAEEFGMPDLQKLSEKYGQPIDKSTKW